MSSKTRDPRSIITPDAFSVNPDLLGTPLARPSRRLAAVLVDVVLVGLITALTSGFWFVLGVVVAAFFIVRASKQGKTGGPSMLFRLFLGCAGLSVLTITISVFLVVRWAQEEGIVEGATLNEDRIEELAERLDSVSEGRVVLRANPGAEARADPEADPSQDPFAALAEPLGDNLPREVDAALESIRDSIQELNDELRVTQAERDDALERGGFTRWLTGKVDDIGFGLGWWTMYFAILMPLMKGQTPGKRALGIRVLRLDGAPVTWWHAFERAGGYAAGFATGLLGFVQIYWDANRQASHDKIAGTVVVRDGAPKVEGLWDAPGQTS